MRPLPRLAGQGRGARQERRLLTWVVGLAGVLVAAVVKDAIGSGFPAIATPLVALAPDVRTAVAVLIALVSRAMMVRALAS